MISVEMIILIANICMNPSILDKDVKQSVRCNQFMLSCVPETLHKQFIKNGSKAFNECYLEFEINK